MSVTDVRVGRGLLGWGSVDQTEGAMVDAACMLFPGLAGKSQFVSYLQQAMA